MVERVVLSGRELVEEIMDLLFGDHKRRRKATASARARTIRLWFAGAKPFTKAPTPSFGSNAFLLALSCTSSTAPTSRVHGLTNQRMLDHAGKTLLEDRADLLDMADDVPLLVDLQRLERHR